MIDATLTSAANLILSSFPQKSRQTNNAPRFFDLGRRPAKEIGTITKTDSEPGSDMNGISLFGLPNEALSHSAACYLTRPSRAVYLCNNAFFELSQSQQCNNCNSR